ncbi:jg3183 [Pararge aegeria aegeria]|uniref:Jg3183 protein n=1 Tax=Pararge aegeria aegeria TaxID=348720 RepID=A0A8S4QRC1_9NEOP|nr:jg3183 [Pararge aegeria aegeria]
MELKRLSICLALFVLAYISHCSDSVAFAVYPLPSNACFYPIALMPPKRLIVCKPEVKTGQKPRGWWIDDVQKNERVLGV